MEGRALPQLTWRRLTRRERRLTTLWLVLAVVLWNGLYDLTLAPAYTEYLFRSALHEAGRAPHMSIPAVMDPAVVRALWVSTLWTSVVLLAGLLTVRLREIP